MASPSTSQASATLQATTAWHETAIGERGPSFVWLHGWGQDHTAFDKLAPLFAANGQHRLFDQPGFGKTPIANPEADTRDYADRLAALLAGTGPHIFIGHSFGVRVSIQMAANHPELVSAIIGIAGAGLQRKRSLWFKAKARAVKTWGQTARLLDKLLGSSLRAGFERKYGSEGYRNAGALRTTFVKVVTEDLSPQAARSACPACLIYGANDTETPPEFGERYSQLMPNAEFHKLPGFDHWDIMTRGAYQCEAIIKQFLSKTLNHD